MDNEDRDLHWARMTPSGKLLDWIIASELGPAINLLRDWTDRNQLKAAALARFQEWTATNPTISHGLAVSDLEANVQDELLVFRDDNEGLVELRVIMRLGIVIPRASSVLVGWFEAETLLDGTSGEVNLIWNHQELNWAGRVLGLIPDEDDGSPF